MAIVEASRLIIFTFRFPVTVGVALDLIGIWLVQLLFVLILADFSSCLWNVESETLAILLLYLEFLLLPFRNREGQHIPPVGNKEKLKKKDSKTSESLESD
jgi:hypothetical protein